VPWPVYSETFVRHAAQGTTLRWPVPAGHRAVITSIMAMAYTTGGEAFAGVNDVPFWFDTLLAKKSFAIACRVVAYSGQTVDGYIQSTGMRITISGYLFKESTVLTVAELVEPILEEGHNLDAEAAPRR